MKRFFLLLILVAVAHSAFAQTKMFINKTSGTDSMWLSDVKSITFKTYSTKATITAFYWDNGWVELTSWVSDSVNRELMIDIDAWNWPPEYSSLNVRFDNILATGDILPSGSLSDDFNDGIINPMWNSYHSNGATIVELNGVIQINIPAGKTIEGYNQVGGLQTKEYVIQGKFDVQVDFEVNPEYHSTPNTNAKLFLTDRNGRSLEISIRNNRYEARELRYQGDSGITIASRGTNQISGKLRLVRH